MNWKGQIRNILREHLWDDLSWRKEQWEEILSLAKEVRRKHKEKNLVTSPFIITYCYCPICEETKQAVAVAINLPLGLFRASFPYLYIASMLLSTMGCDKKHTTIPLGYALETTAWALEGLERGKLESIRRRALEVMSPFFLMTYEEIKEKLEIEEYSEDAVLLHHALDYSEFLIEREERKGVGKLYRRRR